jgi:NADH dehydrogenase
VNEYGTDYLVRIAEQRKGMKFIFTSTQSAHGGNTSAYATTKYRSEEVLKQSDLEWVILRPGLVYGPGNHGLFARMRNTVNRLPVMPLLGGGMALVQAIHVEDLCKGILTIVEGFDDFTKSEFELGDPAGVQLKDFLQKVSHASGKSQRQLNVPLSPVKLAVSTGEKMRLPLPVSMDNLRGLESVKRMDTGPSLKRLNLDLRNLDDWLKASIEASEQPADDRVAVLLIGAGKIGIVHGLQILNNPKARLAAIVDPSTQAQKLYRSMGFGVPFYSTLSEAINSGTKPLAAVVATPADTHYAVAEQCLDAGLSILVEKPLSVDPETSEKWRTLRELHPTQILHSGYMAAQFPHLLTAYHFARMNKLGHIYKARAIALQTHITAAEPVRWEMQKARAGGGVMINFGCHAASMMFRLLGWPDNDVRGWQWPIYSTEVEDAIMAKFSIKATQCTLVASWSVPGYARPYNLVELECEHGTLRVENSCVYVVQDGAATLMETQLDNDLAFNMAPDYTGGGFSLEHEAFIDCVGALQEGRYHGTCKSDFMPPVEMPEALRLESWIRNLYDNLTPEKPDAAVLQDWDIPSSIRDLLLKAGERRQ